MLAKTSRGTSRHPRTRAAPSTKLAKRAKKTGRRLAKIDEACVAELAFYGLSNRNIAVLAGVDDKTIANRFSALLAKKRAERRLAIRERQWEILHGAAGPGPAATMAIWLGKNELGQTDRAAVERSGGQPVQFNVLVAAQGSEARVIDVEPTETLGPRDEDASGRIAAAKPPDAHRPESTERGQDKLPVAPVTVRLRMGRQAGAPPAGELEQDRQDDEDERADADPAPHGGGWPL